MRVRLRLTTICCALAVLAVATDLAPSDAATVVPPYSECSASRVVLTFEPAAHRGDPPHIGVRTSRTRHRLAFANLGTATVAQACHPFNIERRPKRYKVKREATTSTSIECEVAGSVVRIQIGDYAEPVDGASTKRGLAIKTATRNLAFAVIGADARLTFDGEACHRL